MEQQARIGTSSIGSDGSEQVKVMRIPTNYFELAGSNVRNLRFLNLLVTKGEEYGVNSYDELL